MREIKFRGLVIEPLVSGESWITTQGEYCEIYLNHAEKTAYINGHAVKWESVGEYTGLKDKNGKEIYEGDVLLFNNSYNDVDRNWVCVVKYREGSFVCVYPNDQVYNHFDAWNKPKVSWEIIGNIYENPELINS